jgi:hypothetical protein
MAVSFGGPSIQIGRDPGQVAGRAGQAFAQTAQILEGQKQNRVKNAFAALEAGGASRSGFFNALGQNDPLARQLYSDLTGQGGLFGKITGKGFDEDAFQKWKSSPDSVEQTLRAAKDREFQGFLSEDMFKPDIVQERVVAPAGEREVTIAPEADVVEERITGVLGQFRPEAVPGAITLPQRKQMIAEKRNEIISNIAKEEKLTPELTQSTMLAATQYDAIKSEADQEARNAATAKFGEFGRSTSTQRNLWNKMYTEEKQRLLRQKAVGTGMSLEQLERASGFAERIDKEINQFAASIPFEDPEKFDLPSMVESIQTDKNLSQGAKGIATDIAKMKQQVFLRRQQLSKAGAGGRIAAENDAQIRLLEENISKLSGRFKDQIKQDLTRIETQQVPELIEREVKKGEPLTTDEKFEIFYQRMGPAAKNIVAPEGFKGEQQAIKTELDAFQKETNRILALVAAGKATTDEAGDKVLTLRNKILGALGDKTQQQDFLNNETALNEAYAGTSAGLWPWWGRTVEDKNIEWDQKVAKDPDLKNRLDRYAAEVQRAGGQVRETKGGTIIPYPTEQAISSGTTPGVTQTSTDLAAAMQEMNIQ